jgi:ribonuclease HII
LRGLWRIERELRAQGFVHIAGVDEAGRGPLAGPVVAAAAILPPRCRLPGLTDSKLLPPAHRERLCALIQHRAVAVGIGVADARTVDRINVLRAAHLAMERAIAELDPRPDALLVDGRGLPKAPAPQRAIVRGDRLCACIAAASIVAKVVRDRLMVGLDERYPGYGFVRHKGYATPEHLSRLRALGPCPEHRLTFRPVREALQQTLGLEAAQEGSP